MKKSLLTGLLILTLCAGCGKIEMIHYNNVTRSGENGIREIEGSYAKEMDIGEFESLTGLPVRESLPEPYQKESLSVTALYDKNDKIINISVKIGGDGDDSPEVSVYSTELWSELGYSPIGAKYDNETSDSDIEVSKIGLMTTLFYRCDGSENAQNTRHDVYISQFSVGNLYVYVESGSMGKDDFERFAAALIAVGNA